MGILQRFGIGKKPLSAVREIEHPRELESGDIIRFGFANQAELSNEGYTVDRIETLDIGGDATKQCYFMLSGPEQKVRLRVVDNDTVEVSLEVLPDTLLAAFEEHDLAEILDPDSGDQHRLNSKREAEIPPQLQPWVAPKYRQEAHIKAYVYNQDFRTQALPKTTDQGEVGCDYSLLVSDDRQWCLEFRVFDGGRTEAFLSVMLPARKIEELWPRSKGSSS